MSLSSTSVAAEKDKLEGMSWADSNDHTLNFGAQALGFYQWNVNLFFRFPAMRLAYSEEFDYDKSYNVTDSATMTLQVLGPGGGVLTTASASFTYTERRFGDPDDGWNYKYLNKIDELSYGSEKFPTFCGLKYVITSKNKKKQKTRVEPIRSSCSVYWFLAVPCKNMANISYSPTFSVREVFHFGEGKKKADQDNADKEKEAAKAAAKAAATAGAAAAAAAAAVASIPPGN